jgi:prolipoprotein diacylglyceryltransferase
VQDFLKLWDGGLVLYGAVFGATLGFLAYHHFFLRKQNVSVWKLLDVIAPCAALGIALGRIGCLFTGCCYGNVACEGTPGIQFPNTAAAWVPMVKRGHQTMYGFLPKANSTEIEALEPGSAAADLLQVGDVVVEVNGQPALSGRMIAPGDDGILNLKVRRGDAEVTLPSFVPRTIPLNPTQPYETISMCLLLFLLLSYYPFKRKDGELIVLLMLGYGVHRFLNEMLRTDTDPVAFGLTLSQNISLAILAAAVILGIVVWRRPPDGAVQPAGPAAETGMTGLTSSS